VKRWLLALALVAAATGCRPAPDGMRWIEVERGTLSVPVDVSGSMRAVDSDRVGPPGISGVWNYKIAMMADEGSVIEEGEPVLMFDPSDLHRRLENKISERDSAARQLEVQISSAKIARQDEKLALEEARGERRKAELKSEAPEGTTAVIELEKSRLDLEFAKTKVEFLKKKAASATRRDQAEIKRWRRKRDRAEERVQEIQRAIDAMNVKAPRTGTVIYSTNWEGEKKKVGDGVWRAETVLQVVSLEKMEAAGEIDEVDIARVALGQTVSLRLDAQPDVEITGRVTEVGDSIGRTSAENPLKVARITIELDPNADAKLRPGMRFRGQIESERVEDSLLLPLDAIFPTPEGPVVHRQTGEAWEPVAVTLGRRNAHEVVVLEGLEVGARVLRNADEAADGGSEDPS
jgi:multidrug resistance efflux pump